MRDSIIQMFCHFVNCTIFILVCCVKRQVYRIHIFQSRHFTYLSKTTPPTNTYRVHSHRIKWLVDWPEQFTVTEGRLMDHGWAVVNMDSVSCVDVSCCQTHFLCWLFECDTELPSRCFRWIVVRNNITDNTLQGFGYWWVSSVVKFQCILFSNSNSKSPMSSWHYNCCRKFPWQYQLLSTS